MIAGKLEVTIKINELPQTQTVENGWMQFEVDCDGRVVTVTLKPQNLEEISRCPSELSPVGSIGHGQDGRRDRAGICTT